jgi:AraC-like DNA-binding protein
VYFSKEWQHYNYKEGREEELRIPPLALNKAASFTKKERTINDERPKFYIKCISNLSDIKKIWEVRTMSNDNLVDEVAKFILTYDSNELKELSVTSIAKLFKVDRSYLNRKFKTRNKCTLHKFLLNEKMFRAATLLRNSSAITIRELSERMGFFCTDHFSRVFKEHYGITPSKYRLDA